MEKRKRKYEEDKQTSFAKEHLNLNNVYLTDIDGIQVSTTENELYMQYTYNTSIPSIRKFIEVKYNASEYLKKMVKKEIEPSSQIQAYLSMVDEINYARNLTENEMVVFWLVLQTEGNYPFHVFDVIHDHGKVEFDYLGTINDNVQYKTLFEP